MEALADHQPADFRIQWPGGVLDLAGRTHIMGIVNVTPDSFYDGGLYLEPKKAIAQGARLEDEGADIIDVGGESTKPGAHPVPVKEELKRILPVIEGLAMRVGIPVSVDTTKAEVARAALTAGANIVNDVSGLAFDPALAQVAAVYRVPLILGHIKGRPVDMQNDPRYDSVVEEVRGSLKNSLEKATAAGVDPGRIVVDPGIGFGKSVQHNLVILKDLRLFKSLGKPILVGPSRKSFLGKILGLSARESLEGTLAAVAIAVMNGAQIIRVHDVAQVKRVVRIVDAIRNSR